MTFIGVVQIYMKKMAQCVLDISDNTQSKPLVDLQRYSLEMAAAFVCFWMTTAHRAAAAVIESLSVDPCGQGALPDSQYEDLLVHTHTHTLVGFYIPTHLFGPLISRFALSLLAICVGNRESSGYTDAQCHAAWCLASDLEMKLRCNDGLIAARFCRSL